jgi:hypothetical protein
VPAGASPGEGSFVVTGEARATNNSREVAFTVVEAPEVSFESEPAGAAVSVDGEARGVTPLVLRLEPGSYAVQMVLGGYETWTGTVPVVRGAPAPIVAHARLVALKGKQTPKVGLAFDVGGLGDKMFNDSAYAGLKRAVTDFKLGIKEYTYLEGGADREQLLRTLAEQDYGFVIANGWLFRSQQGHG